MRAGIGMVASAVLTATILATPATAHVPDRCQRLTNQVEILAIERVVTVQAMKRSADRGDISGILDGTATLMNLDGRFFTALTRWLECIAR